MDIQVTEKENWVRGLDINVPHEELEPEFEKALKDLQKKVKLEGFRKGKVPMGLVKKLYGAKVQMDVIQDILPDLFAKASIEKNLNIAAPAKVTDVDYHPGGELNVQYDVEVEPEFELVSWENMKFDRKMYKATDVDIEESLDHIRRDFATWKKIEGKVEKHHFVKCDLQELDESGVPIIGNKHENQFLMMTDDDGNVTDFGNQLEGAESGETRTVMVTPPANPETGEPVKSIKFSITINEIHERTLPELDDELAKDAGDYETLEDLKNELTNRITRNTQKQLDKELYHKIINELIGKNTFELPEGMVDFYLDHIIEDMKKNPKSGTMQDFDEEKVRQQYRDGAIFNIKWRLIREKIIELNEINVDEDEVKNHAEQWAKDRGVAADRYWNEVKKRDDRLKEIRYDVLEQKVLNFLVERQKIKEKKVTRKDLEKQN